MPKKQDELVVLDRHVMNWVLLAVLLSAFSILTSLYVLFRLRGFNSPLSSAITISSEDWNEFVQETQKQIVRARVETRLQLIRAKLQLQDSNESILGDVDQLESDFEKLYQSVDENTRSATVEAQHNLAQLRIQVQNDAAAALQTVEQMIASLQEEISPDER